MSANIQTPCIEIPSISSIPKISLPFGVELQAIADLSKGPPTNCALLHSLMVQLMPTLAGLTCVIRILNLLSKLADVVKALPNLFSAAKKIGDVTSAIEDMSDCLNIINPGALAQTIKDILLLVISYLECFVAAIRSIFDFQAGINLDVAEGNPELVSSLQCASDNAQTSMQQMQLGLAAIGPLFTMIQTLIDISGPQIELPAVGDLADASDMASAVDQLDEMLVQLRQIVASIQ